MSTWVRAFPKTTQHPFGGKETQRTVHTWPCYIAQGRRLGLWSDVHEAGLSPVAWDVHTKRVTLMTRTFLFLSCEYASPPRSRQVEVRTRLESVGEGTGSKSGFLLKSSDHLCITRRSCPGMGETCFLGAAVSTEPRRGEMRKQKGSSMQVGGCMACGDRAFQSYALVCVSTLSIQLFPPISLCFRL